MADEYECIGPAEGAPAPPPDAPPPAGNPEGNELKSATGDTGTATGQGKDGSRSQAGPLKLPKGIKEVPKQKLKSSEMVNFPISKSGSKSGRGKVRKAPVPTRLNDRTPLYFMIVAAMAFTISLILTFIIMGHAWFGFEFIESFIVDNEP